MENGIESRCRKRKDANQDRRMWIQKGWNEGHQKTLNHPEPARTKKKKNTTQEEFFDFFPAKHISIVEAKFKFFGTDSGYSWKHRTKMAEDNRAIHGELYKQKKEEEKGPNIPVRTRTSAITTPSNLTRPIRLVLVAKPQQTSPF